MYICKTPASFIFSSREVIDDDCYLSLRFISASCNSRFTTTVNNSQAWDFLSFLNIATGPVNALLWNYKSIVFYTQQ